MVDPLAVGLVGAGPWATIMHAPTLAAGPETRLAAVWARRPEAASALAAPHGAVACATFAELLDRCEAVAFSVPPDVQAELAVVAAGAGKALLLDKPIAGSLDGARRLADAVGAAGVGSLVVFTARFSAKTRRFLADAASGRLFGGYVLNVTGAFLEGPFSRSPWRHEGGALLDIGPHAIDLLSAALGDVVDVDVRLAGEWAQLSLEHAGGAASAALLSCHVPGEPRYRCELFDASGGSSLDEPWDAEAFPTLRREFADVARSGGPHPCDVRRGLAVQVVLDIAQRRAAAR
jgi:predicted dehydrogenase